MSLVSSLRQTKVPICVYQYSIRNISSQSVYNRIKSCLPWSSSTEELSQHERRKWDELSFLTNRYLHDPSNLVKLQHDYKIIYAIGVSHHSRLSALRVQSLCDDLWPDTIFLELCDKRLERIRLNVALQSPLSNKLKSMMHRLSSYNLFNYYKHGPFVQAICIGDTKKLTIKCGDIDSEMIMKELRDALEAKKKPFEQVINEKKYSRYLFLNQVINEYIMHMRRLFNIGNEDENVYRREKRNQGMEKSRKEARNIVNKYSNIVYEILHGQREQYMVKQLHQCPGDIIVAIVGIGHLDGIEKHWNDYHYTKGNTSTSKLDDKELLDKHYGNT